MKNQSYFTVLMTLLKPDKITVFCIGFVLLLYAVYLQYNKRRRLPPGPMGLPILGYYPFLKKDPLKTLCDLGKKYGNVFGFYIGPKYLVVLNDWDTMIEAYSQNLNLDRPLDLFTDMPYRLGINAANGIEWKQTRRLTSKSMKEIGLYDENWEKLVQEEVNEVVDRIFQHGPGPLEIRSFFGETFTNNIMSLILGKRFPTGHPINKMVSRSVDEILENSPSLDMSNFSPRLRRILEILGFEKEFSFQEIVQTFRKFVSNYVEEKIRNSKEQTGESFIDRYYLEVENHRRNKIDSYITEYTLKGNVLIMLAGGSETSRTTTIWLLMAMAENQEVQRKVQEELDKVIGKDGSIHWADRMKIPYTYATFLESMRWKTIVPITTLRMTIEDMQVQGYHIPKGTYMSVNSEALHHDTRYWNEPEKFIPERFLLDGGHKVNSTPKSYNPFSYGKRNCPGKLIAMMEILVYFTKFMQNFTVVPSDGEKVKHGAHLGLTYEAKDMYLRFIPR